MSLAEWTARSIVAGEQRLLDLLGKQPFAADLRKRAVLDAVSGGRDGDDLELRLGQAMRLGEAPAHLLRLRERQRRSAGADTSHVLHGAGFRCYAQAD